MTQSKNSTCRQRAKAKQSITAAIILLGLCVFASTRGTPAQVPVQSPTQAPTQVVPVAPGQRPMRGQMPAQAPSNRQAPAPNRPPFAATDGLSFGDRLQHLESIHGMGTAPPDAAILDRTARLEQRVFGQVQAGSIVDRLKSLEAAQAKAAAPPVIPGAMAEIIKNAHVGAIVTLPDIYPPCFLHVPLASENLADTSDYLDAVLKESKNKVLKFQKMPVPIYITPIQEVGFAKSIKEAFDDWDLRTGGLVKFVEVKNSKDARIIVIFSRMGLKAGSDCSLGAHTVTKWKSRGSGRMAFLPIGAIPVPLYIPAMGPKYSVPPQVIEVNLDVIYNKEAEVRLSLLKNIATHEVGHALGMLGHSPDQADMMYSITDEHSRISQRDINTVSRLYLKKVDIPL